MEESPTNNGEVETRGFLFSLYCRIPPPLQPTSFNQSKGHINSEYYHFVTAIIICVTGAREGAVG